MSSIGLAIIAKDEEENLPKLLRSIEGAFDEVVLVDTGSTDDTVRVFTTWADEQSVRMRAEVGYFKWCDDFAAARNYADSLIKSDWIAWADCDDIIVNAEAIRDVVARTPDNIAGIVCGYDYAQEPNTGQCICFLKRERIVRRGAGNWIGRVHEAQSVNGPTMYVPPSIFVWKHIKQAGFDPETAGAIATKSNIRNLAILQGWLKDEPENPRVLAYIGTELASQGRHEEAITHYLDYLRVSDGGWRDEYAQVMRKVAASLVVLGRIDDALEYGYSSIKFHPSWPDGYLTLGQCLVEQGKFEEALHWVDSGLIKEPSETMLIYNPLDYNFVPLRIKAFALAGLGRYNEALAVTEQAMSVFPDAEIGNAARGWESIVKKEQTAEAFVNAAKVLVGHDEQWKARTLLEKCVPHYCQDHPLVVNARSEVRSRTLWATDPDAYARHYREGGSKPEDFLDDETSDRVAAALPRASFLTDGILEQAGIET